MGTQKVSAVFPLSHYRSRLSTQLSESQNTNYVMVSDVHVVKPANHISLCRPCGSYRVPV